MHILLFQTHYIIIIDGDSTLRSLKMNYKNQKFLFLQSVEILYSLFHIDHNLLNTSSVQ